MRFKIGDRVWWWHTPGHRMFGTITELEDRPGIKPDDDRQLLYLDAHQLHQEIPAEDGIYSGIDDNSYHADPGSLSSSGARALLPPSAPAIFRYEQLHRPVPKKEYDFGHLAHLLVLGEGAKIAVLDPEVHGRKKDGGVADSPRSTATWKQAEAEARERGEVPVHVDDFRKAQTMAAQVMQHPAARVLFEAAGQAELSGYWHDPETGVRLRFRTDWLCEIGGRVIGVDYKTSTSADPAHFARACGDYGYHQQDAWYRAGLVATEISDDPDFLFVVQSKTAPHLVSVNRIRPNHVELGARRNRKAIDLYAKCAAADHWPAYGDHIHNIELPPYAAYRQEEELAS